MGLCVDVGVQTRLFLEVRAVKAVVGSYIPGYGEMRDEINGGYLYKELEFPSST